MQTLPHTTFRFIFHFIKKYHLHFIFMLIFFHASAIDNIAWPTVTSMIVDAIEAHTGKREDIWSAIAVAVTLGASVWILIEVFFRLAFILAINVFPKLESDIRMAMYDYVNQQSYNYFSNNFAGSLANKINDMARSTTHVITMVMSLFIPVLTTITILTIMFTQIYAVFGLLIFVWFTLHMTISIATAKKCSYLADRHAESRSILSGRIVDSFANSISVRLFSRYAFEHSYVLEQQKDEVEKHKESLWYLEKIKIVLGIIAFIFLGVILTYLQVYTYKTGITNLGELVFTLQASFHITMLTWWAGSELPRFFQEIGVCQQALKLIATPIEVKDVPDAKPITVSKGDIKFENVTFRYSRNNNIFENNSVHILSGQKIGLVGFSGSGKTTFVSLLLRYFDINEGRILIDGQDISKATQDSLRRQISFIPQEPMLFHRSLMENIRYGKLDATDEEVIEASKKAHCDEFIIKLKNGYHTTVGERGLKISGGQRQRIAIARAILKQTPILVMDEATSALDSVTEKKIQDSLKEVSHNRTTIVIAHRLSTLADMDRILVFKDGDIVEDGSHKELITTNGHYSKLWNMQTNGLIPDKEDD